MSESDRRSSDSENSSSDGQAEAHPPQPPDMTWTEPPQQSEVAEPPPFAEQPSFAQQPFAPAQAPQPYQGQAQGGQQVAPKNPPLMALISFFIPGVGTMLNGNVGLGIIMLVSYIGVWAFSALLWAILLGWLMWPFMLGIVIWAMVDSYKGAQRWNAMHGIIS